MLKDQIKVTSKNRGAAKRLLSTWHPSTVVRTWTVSQLTAKLWQAINEGLITVEGAHRALFPQDYSNEGAATGTSTDGKKSDAERDAEFATSASDGQGESGDAEGDGDGESNAEGDAEAKGETEAEKEAYAQGYTDGQASPDDDNGMDGDALHGEEGDAYLNGYRDGQKDGKGEEGDENESEASESDESEASDENESEEGEGEGEEEASEEQEEEEERTEPKDHPKLVDVIKYVKAGLNVALVGPAGSGKSYITRQVAEALNADYYVNGSCMSKYDLIGYCDANGTYHPTPAYEAFTKGGVHTFDELDASMPEAVVAFNGMTDDQPFYTFPNGQHVKHADYVAVACMNTWGNGADADYVGRFKQDAASMNRFVRVHIDYNESVERAIADKDIVERCHAVRRACEALGIRHVVSTRTIKHMQKARDAGVCKSKLDRDILFAGLSDDTIRQIKGQVK